HTRFSRDWSSDVCSSDLECDRQLKQLATDGAYVHIETYVGRARPGSSMLRPNLVHRWRFEARRDHLVLSGRPAFRDERAFKVSRSEERRVGKEWRSRVPP